MGTSCSGTNAARYGTMNENVTIWYFKIFIRMCITNCNYFYCHISSPNILNYPSHIYAENVYKNVVETSPTAYYIDNKPHKRKHGDKIFHGHKFCKIF